ncbi:MAG: 3-deoxy-manno-octulosonate cytidylyltransferase (CMP-KDO synthetase) [Pelagibacterales bacterium]|nr:3-deoxy-manno-octulosonate cytidylyltransferase (CMP-KDO synthetase) [Pelagibacterales bacterium]
MKNTAIIIPTRLEARRLPNKPLLKINDLPMIIHVLNRAKESKVGEVFVATSDREIIDVVKKNGGQTIMTNKDHLSGSDRVYEAYLKELQERADLIVNLQGDMPNIKTESIKKLVKFMRESQSDIGTLASDIKNKDEINNNNIVKVEVEENLKSNNFIAAKDFFRIKKDLKSNKIYHHIGIYAFTNIALTQYVKLSRSKLEIERNLEQMRAMENNMTIMVGLSKFNALGVDTEEDLNKVIKEMG